MARSRMSMKSFIAIHFLRKLRKKHGLHEINSMNLINLLAEYNAVRLLTCHPSNYLTIKFLDGSMLVMKKSNDIQTYRLIEPIGVEPNYLKIL